MAHYAKLNDENIVLSVIVLNNDDEMIDGVEDEATGIAFCSNLTGYPNWKKTSYNGNIRKNYAGIGYKYDAELDAFISPQPFPSWTLNENCRWIPPVPRPTDRKQYAWNEALLQWDEVPR
jgi:hypothetical protein